MRPWLLQVSSETGRSTRWKAKPADLTCQDLGAQDLLKKKWPWEICRFQTKQAEVHSSKLRQLDLQAAYKEWLWIWDYYMILICLSFHNPSWQPWVTVKLTCSVVMLTWSYSTSWKLGHRTYNQYLFTEHTTIILGKKNNNPYRVSVLKMKSFQTQAHWICY